MLLWKCTVGDSKNSQFVKDPEASGFLSSLEVKTPLSKILLLGLYLF